MLENSGKNAKDRQKAVLHQDPVSVELLRVDTAGLRVDTAGPHKLPETHVPPAATGAVHGRVAGDQPGTQQLPASLPGPAAFQGQAGERCCGRSLRPPASNSWGGEGAQQLQRCQASGAPPTFQGSPLPSGRRQTSSPCVRVDTGVQR